MLDDAVLDDPVGESLRGDHAHLARTHGRAVAYRPEVASFVAVPVDHGPQDWDDLAELLGPDGFADLFNAAAEPPGWAPVFAMHGVQLVGPTAAPDAEPVDHVVLGAADVADMTALVEATRPGPFKPETIRMGTYLGVRREGRLVAMAGERLRPPGWTEISGVCTAPEARGEGLASRLVGELVRRIVAQGRRPFLHVATDNAAALRVYRGLGFAQRRDVRFHGYLVPGGD